MKSPLPTCASNRFGLQVELVRPATFFIIARFLRQRGRHGFFSRLFKKQHPEIRVPEFDDNARIEVSEEHRPLLETLLLDPGLRNLVVWITQHDLNLFVVGADISAARRLYMRRLEPSIDEVARALAAARPKPSPVTLLGAGG